MNCFVSIITFLTVIISVILSQFLTTVTPQLSTVLFVRIQYALSSVHTRTICAVFYRFIILTKWFQLTRLPHFILVYFQGHSFIVSALMYNFIDHIIVIFTVRCYACWLVLCFHIVVDVQASLMNWTLSLWLVCCIFAVLWYVVSVLCIWCYFLPLCTTHTHTHRYICYFNGHFVQVYLCLPVPDCQPMLYFNALSDGAGGRWKPET